MPDGTHPIFVLERERKVAMALYDEFGGMYIANGSFSAMFRNKLLPWVTNLLNVLSPALFGTVFEGERVPVTMNINPPVSTPAESLRTLNPTQQYNMMVSLSVVKGGVKYWNCDIMVPVMIGSTYCLTHGKSAVERYEAGIGTTDRGGYVLNGKGATIVRAIETAHPTIPKILVNSPGIEKTRKRGEKHAQNALNVLASYVAELREQRLLDHHFADTYMFDEKMVADIAQILKKGADGLEGLSASASPKQRTKARSKRKMGASNANAEDDTGSPGSPGSPSSPSSPEEREAPEMRMLRTIIRIAPHVVVSSPTHAESGKKMATNSIVESIMTTCSSENIYALPTNLEIYAMDLTFYVWISLPATNKSLHVPLTRYVPSALGVAFFSGKLLNIFHALFYGRYHVSEQISDEDFYAVGMPNFKSDVIGAICAVTTGTIRATVMALLEQSFNEYDEMVRNLSPFEFYVLLFGVIPGRDGSESGKPKIITPTIVNIKYPRQLINHVVDYIVPMQLNPIRDTTRAGDIYLAKALALSSIFVEHARAVETQNTSNLHAYASKMIISPGTAIFRFIRERINLMVFMGCAGSIDNPALQKATKSTCILSSFTPKRTMVVSKGDTGPQSIMALIRETAAKKDLLVRTITVPGTVRVGTDARRIQYDQVANVDVWYTPEGEDVGKRKELAILGLVTFARDLTLIYRYIHAAIIASNQGEEPGIGVDPRHVTGTDIRLLFTDALPFPCTMKIPSKVDAEAAGDEAETSEATGTYQTGCLYVSSEFFGRMEKYFNRNGPVRDDVLHPYNLRPIHPAGQDGDMRSRIETFDIVFSSKGNRYTIFYSGGIVGHLALARYEDRLIIDYPVFREKIYGSDPWKNPNARKLIETGAVVLVTPMRNYFECSSTKLFYATPSIMDMPLIDGTPTRDVAIIKADQNICKWCWHRAVPINDPRPSRRLDDDGQLNAGIYAETRACGCGQKWHSHCAEVIANRFKFDFTHDQCPSCADKSNVIFPPVVRNFREDYDVICIDPATTFGTSSSIVPFSNEVNGVRVAYEGNMGPQSTDSATGLAELQELETKESLEAHVPITSPWFQAENTRERNVGVNAIVATIMRGRNNEDGKEISSTAARELFRYKHHMTVRARFPQKGTLIRYRGKTHKVGSVYLGQCSSVEKNRFHAIDPSTGLPKIGSYLRMGDAIIGIYIITDTEETIDKSTYATVEQYGYVSQVNVRRIDFTSGSGGVQISDKAYVSVTMSVIQCYLTGDKLHMQYSQKGVVAQILERKDMGRIVGGPFDGCVPDLIDAPTSRPTRMTVGLDTELAQTKLALLELELKDATAFRRRLGLPDETGMTKSPDFDDTFQRLVKLGCPGGIIEKMRLPTGEIVDVSVGCARILPLRHHASTKTKSGPYDPTRIGGDIFRQGISGRKGASRIGYQEVQGMYSMGSLDMLKSMISMGSQTVKVLHCGTCGLYSTLPPKSGLMHTCDACGGQLFSAEASYSFMVLGHILASRGIDMRAYPSLE